MLRMDPVQIIVIVLFMAIYASITLYLVGPQSDCLSVRDFTAQLQHHKLRADASGLLERLTADEDGVRRSDEDRKQKQFDEEAADRGVRGRRVTRRRGNDFDGKETDPRWMFFSAAFGVFLSKLNGMKIQF